MVVSQMCGSRDNKRLKYIVQLFEKEGIQQCINVCECRTTYIQYKGKNIVQIINIIVLIVLMELNQLSIRGGSSLR